MLLFMSKRLALTLTFLSEGLTSSSLTPLSKHLTQVETIDKLEDLVPQTHVKIRKRADRVIMLITDRRRTPGASVHTACSYSTIHPHQLTLKPSSSR